QMSLHHPTIVHGSGLNKTNDRRIGFVVQSYIGSNVNQVLGKMYVQQARGDDTFNYHQHTKRPSSLMNSEDIEMRKKANDDLQRIFYPGSTKKGDF
ncbi:phytanoyl-CoA dioxygenase family protein, partial [Candidatus Pelagibacter ubique]|nr:phytanoyl-CoA dioxygenase family protein [Candidatus Pelagibacter ubique]